MKNILKNIKQNDPSIHSLFEAFFHPFFKAMLHYKIARMFYNFHLFTIARILTNHCKKSTGIELHPGAKIGKNFFVDHGLDVVVGETAIIGDNVTLFQGVTLGGRGFCKGKRHPTLKNNIIVGSGAKILGNITIGNNVKIGANAVVLKDIPDNCTVVGIPGKIVKKDNIHNK